MIPPAIPPGRNPNGLISVIYDAAGGIIRTTNLTPGEDQEANALADADVYVTAREDGRHPINVIYDGDTGHRVLAIVAE